jgi:crossover junction endodeoxyribonuclease RuvC
MRVLGVDPGLSTTGIGIIEGSGREMHALEWLTITTDPSAALVDRLAEIGRDLVPLLQEFRPDLAVVEQVFFAKNERTAIGVAHARGVLLMHIGSQGIPVLEVTPMQLKSAITGDGRADKAQIGTMLVRWLKMDTVPTPPDAADALALAVYGAQHNTLI